MTLGILESCLAQKKKGGGGFLAIWVRGVQLNLLGAIEKVGLSCLSVKHGRGANDHKATVTQTCGIAVHLRHW